MLKIYFGEMAGKVIHDVDSFFNNQYRYVWLQDDLVKEMILDVDKSEVESPECIKSPVLRQIPPTKLSGGVKALILMKYLDESDGVVNASACGDNCARWILKMSESFNLTINLNHIMDFGDVEFTAEILNDNSIVNNMRDFVDKAITFLR